MKKIALSVLIIGSFLIYSLVHQTKQANPPSLPLTDSQNNSVTPKSSSLDDEDIPNGSVTPVPTVTGMMMRNTYKDGQYTGNVADAFYGNVQVQITIGNGKISNIKFLDYPQDRRTSIEINSQAMPILISETIQSQNASVDSVSGATQTSRAYIESLQSALAKAKSS